VKRVVIIGAGGHGREVADILRHQSQNGNGLSLLGFIDENRTLHHQTVDDLPVLGDWSWFDGVDRSEVAVICGLGSPQITKRLAQRASSIDLDFVNAISPLAHVSPFARLGQGIVMFPHAIANTGTFLGDHCILNVAATISHDTKLGRYVNINPGVHLAGNVSVGEGSYIGMGAKVIQGMSIGEWTVVGAGAVVTAELQANVTAVGVPAKVIKSREEGWYE